MLRPLKIQGGRNITVGKGVVIGRFSWLATDSQISGKATLIIGDGCMLGNFNHIYSTRSIVFEKNVLTADKVYIADNQHAYEDVSMPVWQQPVKQLNDVTIGEGAWLGENVCILGACVGKGCVIGANSVVIRDIPDYCVAVGTPARVVKKYNFITKQWEKTY